MREREDRRRESTQVLSGVFLKVFLQCCVSFCHTTARISHNYKKSIPSLPNLPPLPSLQPSGLARSLRLGFPSHTQARTSYPFHMRQCVNPALSLPTMPTSPFPTSVVCLCVYTYAQWSITQHKKEQVWVTSSEADKPRACYTEWSRLEREKQISYINIYM